MEFDWSNSSKQERLDFLYESGLGVGKASASEGFKALEAFPKSDDAPSSSATAPSKVFCLACELLLSFNFPVLHVEGVFLNIIWWLFCQIALWLFAKDKDFQNFLFNDIVRGSSLM